MKTTKLLCTATIVGVSMLLQACSSIQTQALDDAHQADGLIYYLPMKDITVTFAKPKVPEKKEKKADESKNDAGASAENNAALQQTNAEQEQTTAEPPKELEVSIGTSHAYADIRQRFVLNYQSSLLADNKLVIGTDEQGLLQSTQASAKSQFGEVFQALGESAGVSDAPGVVGLSDSDSSDEIVRCPKTSRFSFSFPLDRVKKRTVNLCDDYVATVELAITNANVATDENASAMDQQQADESDTVSLQSRSGVYYRRELPYRVTVEKKISENDSEFVVESVVSSPSESKTHFLPVPVSLFSDNTSKLTFNSGAPTVVDYEVKSELVSLLSIPAKVVGSYFEGVGKVFNGFSSARTKETDLLKAELALLVARDKLEDCRKAYEKNDEDALAKLGCS